MVAELVKAIVEPSPESTAPLTVLVPPLSQDVFGAPKAWLTSAFCALATSKTKTSGNTLAST